MKIEVSVAPSSSLDEAWELNHEVYCRELGQHQTEAGGRRVDARSGTALYIVAKDGEKTVGMLSASMPGSSEFSTLSRLPKDHPEHLRANESTEVRLLAVRREYRGRGIYDRLIFALMELSAAKSLDRILISAVVSQMKLYTLMGFIPIGHYVAEGCVLLQPMLLTRTAFEASPYRRNRLARMEQCL